MLPTDFRIASAVDTLCISIPHVWVGVVSSISLRLTQSAIYHIIETKDFRKSITTVAIFIQSPTIVLSVDETIFNCLKLIRLLLYIALEYS